jgi:ABC-2 type transport system ATP-binding protein
MQPVLSLSTVTKRYGDHLAVADLSFEAASGEMLGFLGPNGAGKTTTIRLLMGFLRPDAGQVRLFDCDMADPTQARKARRRLGFVPDVAGLDPDATGSWLLDELAHLQGRAPLDREELIERLELAAADLRRPIKRLSRGTRQKVNIVQGLQHRPELIVLDEPTEGLDPLTKRTLFDILRSAKARGVTIFFSSHVLSEVEEHCDRVALIRGGRLAAVNQIEALRGRGLRRVTLSLLSDELAYVTERLAQLPGVSELRRVDQALRFYAADLPALLATLPELPVADLIIEPPSLEDVFMDFYRREGGDHG